MFSRYLIRLSRSEAFSVIRQPISRLLPFGIITHIAHVCAAAEYNVCVCVCVCPEGRSRGPVKLYFIYN